MEFDREGEFDKVMEEIFPVSIPSNFVKSISVKLANGQQVILKGDELINPLPVNNDFSWDKLVSQFDSIEDIQVFVDIPAIRENVVMNVRNILSQHFEDMKKRKNKANKKPE